MKRVTDSLSHFSVPGYQHLTTEFSEMCLASTFASEKCLAVAQTETVAFAARCLASESPRGPYPGLGCVKTGEYCPQQHRIYQSRLPILSMEAVPRIKVPQENIQITPIFLVSWGALDIPRNAAISYITACCQALSAEGILQVDVESLTLLVLGI
jgi:hypothetical protein